MNQQVLRELLDKHTELSEQLEGLNPFRESDMADIKPQLERELLTVGNELAEAVHDMLGEARSA